VTCERLSDHFKLPDGAMPNGCVAVCQYLSPDGDMRYAVLYDTTELPLSSTLGLLELAKQHLYRAADFD
jgi:hypothetical protein